MPSRAEGFGLPLLEAMSLGVPVIASDAPALVEVAGGAAVHHAVGDASALAEAMRAVVEDGAVGACATRPATSRRLRVGIPRRGRPGSCTAAFGRAKPPTWGSTSAYAGAAMPVRVLLDATALPATVAASAATSTDWLSATGMPGCPTG